MRAFFKTFFACLLALIIFSIIGFLLMIGISAVIASGEKEEIADHGILVLDMSVPIREQGIDALELGSISKYFTQKTSLGLHDVVSCIKDAASDDKIKGLYIKAGSNVNGIAVNDELRKAILDFKKSKKSVIAYGSEISEGALYLASAADYIYTHPLGGVEWNGIAVNITFYKGLLDKLQIQPEIFYAGKFKSATEPFRVNKMTDANRIQTSEMINDIYSNLLISVSESRHIDTSRLHQLANNGQIQTAADAVKYKLIDGVKYNDEIATDLRKISGVGTDGKLNLINMSTYIDASEGQLSGSDKIAVIYGEGAIVDGKSDEENIGGESLRALIEKARKNKNVKAIVLRVNSPGGSAMASDVIWREVTLAKKAKPVIVSMGTYAASGGYYISCAGDHIFAEPNTVTGSIGVFSMLINPSQFLNNKLGITFDGVKTGPLADIGTGARPMTDFEKRIMQASVDTVYHTFLSRVAEGRHRSIAEIDSIGQGRVWVGKRAIEKGLVDEIGTLDDALKYAARKAHLKDYSILEYPTKKSYLERIFAKDNGENTSAQEQMMRAYFGTDFFDWLKKIRTLQLMSNSRQARMPFEIEFK